MLMFRKLFISLIASACVAVSARAGSVGTAENDCLSLDSCRSLALAYNKDLRRAEARIKGADYTRRSAFTLFLPKINASAMYMHTGKELSLLSDGQKSTLSNIGTALGMPRLNSVGEGLVDALRTDTRNAAGVAVLLTQPIYMGGKIRAANRIAGLASEIASDRREIVRQQLIADVEEAYWNVVSLSARKRVAESYRELVCKLHSDVEQMIAAGMATSADGLSVKVKVNEADLAIMALDNGISLTRMHLCQLCGLDQNTDLVLADECLREPIPDAETVATPAMPGTGDMYLEEWESRPELRALSAGVDVAEEKVKMARASFMPSLALAGGWAMSYPSVFNSFEKKMKGTWNIGVTLNVPLLTWGDRRYKVRAAQAEAEAARFELDETREKIELQVNQARHKLSEAYERLRTAISGREAAEENMRYATYGLQEGTIPLSNVLEAQTNWLAATTSVISSEIDIKLARVALSRALGIL